MHSIWAIAQNTLAQALRMKIAVVTILLLLILLPIMGKIMVGDGTLMGKLQTFSSYSLGLISLLLCVLTIAISAFTLSNDLKRKHIYMVLTKPIRRCELLIGKLLGVILLNGILLAVFGTIVYLLTLLIWSYSDAPAEQRMRAEAEFFTSRIGIKYQLNKDEINQRALKRFKELKERGQIPEGMSFTAVIDELYGQEAMLEMKADPGQSKTWAFENVRVKNAQDPNAIIFVRYKLQAVSSQAEEQVFGRWRIGDLRQLQTGAKITTPIYSVDRPDAVRTVREFPVWADAVTEDGYLGLEFRNDPSLNQTTVIPEDVEILYKTSTFTENYVRTILLIYVRLIFLAALGISLSTWLSFPVAILVCLVFFCAGLTNGFIVDAIDGLEAAIGMIYNVSVKPVLWLLPQFDGAHNPTNYIVEGRTLPWSYLAVSAGITLLLKAMILFFFGMLIFSRREVAKAVV